MALNISGNIHNRGSAIGNIRTGSGTQSSNYRIALAKAEEMQKEADRLNSFRSLAAQTIKGLPRSIMSDIPKQVVKHPLRTAGIVAQESLNGFAVDTANALSSYARIPKIPRISLVKPQNQTEEGMAQGFRLGGMAGAYRAGGVLLKPLLNSAASLNTLGRIPGVLDTAAKVPAMRPLAETLIGDQILTQAFSDRDTPWKERALNAAITPIATFGANAIGRTAMMARDGVNKARGIQPREQIDLSGLSNEERLAEIQKMSLGDDVEAFKESLDASPQAPFKLPPESFGQKLYRKIFSSGRSSIQRYGKEGEEVAKKMDQYYPEVHQHESAVKKGAKAQLEGSTKDDWVVVQRAIENPELRGENLSKLTLIQQRVFNAVQKVKKYTHELAKANGWKLQGPDGKMYDWPQDDALADVFWPHYWFNDMVKPTKQAYRESLIKDLLKKGYSELAAQEHATATMKPGPNKLLSSVEHSRMTDVPGYAEGERLHEVLDRMIHEQAVMKARIEIFGQSGEKMEGLVSQMIAKAGPEGEQVAKDIRAILDEMFGNSEVSNRFIRGALKFQQFTKLSTGGITNLTQIGNTSIVGGIKNTLHTLWKIATSPTERALMKDYTEFIGALDQLNITQEANIPTGKIMDFALAFFKWTEKWNRIIAADVGVAFSKQLSAAVKANPLDEKSARMLMKLGLTIDDVAKLSAGQPLKQETITKLASNFVNDTQFQLNAMNLPIWSRTPMGKLFTQFKSFGYMQTKFYYDHVYREAKQGNMTPLIRAVAVVPGLFIMAKKGRDIITVRDPALRDTLGLSNYEEPTEDEKAFKDLETLLQVTGTLPGGILQNAMFSMKNNWGEGSEYRTPINKTAVTLGNMLGPTVSDFGNLGKAMEQSGDIQRENLLDGNQGEGNQLRTTWPYEKFGVGMIPYVGQGIRNTVYRDWPTREREDFRANLKEMLTEYYDTRDPGLAAEIKALIDTQQKKNVLNDVKGEVKRDMLSPEDKALYERLQERKRIFKTLPIINGTE